MNHAMMEASTYQVRKVLKSYLGPQADQWLRYQLDRGDIAVGQPVAAVQVIPLAGIIEALEEDGAFLIGKDRSLKLTEELRSLSGLPD